MSAPQRRNLHDLAKAVNTATKKQVAVVADGWILSDVRGYVSFGCWALDLAVGGGSLDRMGMPEGRIIEIFGEESTGKSTIMVELFKSAIAAGGDAVLIDTEAKFNKTYAEHWGLDLSRVMTLKANTIEDGFRYIAILISKIKEEGTSNLPLVIAWDTIAAASTKREIIKLDKSVKKKKKGEKEDDEEKGLAAGMASKARAIRESARQLAVECMDARVTLVAVNQIIDNIGGYGPAYTTPGGRALKYGSTIRLDVKRKSKIIEEDAAKVKFERGAEMSVRLHKCEYNQGRTVIIPFYYHKGIDNGQALFRLVWPEMIKRDLASQGGGGWYKVLLPGVEPVSFRMAQIDDIMRDDPRVKDLMFSVARDLLAPPSERTIPLPHPEEMFWVTIDKETIEKSAAGITEMVDADPSLLTQTWVMPIAAKDRTWKTPAEFGFQQGVGSPETSHSPAG